MGHYVIFQNHIKEIHNLVAKLPIFIENIKKRTASHTGTKYNKRALSIVGESSIELPSVSSDQRQLGHHTRVGLVGLCARNYTFASPIYDHSPSVV